MALNQFTCIICGDEFEARNRSVKTGKHAPKYCSRCKREGKRLYMVQYRLTPSGQAACAKAYAKYSQSIKLRESRRRRSTKFRATLLGKLGRLRQEYRRIGRGNNPDLYVSRVKQLHDMKESCTVCGIPYKRTHTIDHIVALCNGGRDEWDNFQPICTGKDSCHVKKTRRDMQEFYKRQAINGIKEICYGA